MLLSLLHVFEFTTCISSAAPGSLKLAKSHCAHISSRMSVVVISLTQLYPGSESEFGPFKLLH